MSGIDLADQRRAAYTTHQRTRRNWMSLLWLLLNLSIINTHILFLLKRHAAFVKGFDKSTLLISLGKLIMVIQS